MRLLRLLWCLVRRYHDWRASSPGNLICADCETELQANPCAECPLLEEILRLEAPRGHA